MTTNRRPRICVFCGASDSVDKTYLDGAEDFGVALAKAGFDLVYGGGGTGLMGRCATGVLKAGGDAIGVIPTFLQDRELAKRDLTELHVVEDMHTRKAKMFELCDGFAVLPGGIGTLEELFEIATWRQLERHDKPIVLVSIEDFWTPLRALYEAMADAGFVHGDKDRLMVWANTVPEAVDALTHTLTRDVA